MLSIALFLTAISVAVYVLIGYPVLLGLLAWLRPRPILKSRQQKPISILIAVHNGEGFLADKLQSILALDYPRELLEILVVSDGSTDQTLLIAEQFASRGVQSMQIPRSGKCAALNTAISRTTNEILLLTDVRQTLAPDSVQKLVDCFADSSVGAVSGELVIREGASHDEVSTGLYWRYESWIRQKLSRIDSIFGATGPFYAMRRELAVPLPLDTLLDDMYLPLAAFLKGYRLVVEPTARAYDYPTSRETEFLRKVRTLAGNYQILLAYPALLGPQNRMWFHYVSYKLGRLALPWVFTLLFVSSCFLPVPWRWGALAVQALLYGAAALDPVIPVNFPLKRITSISRTFVALLLAALWGLSVFVVPPRRLWKETKVAIPPS
jgi:biofilm PGA synthesis N-glycosyltransferase PgaC